jgi:penicillin-binding protein 2
MSNKYADRSHVVRIIFIVVGILFIGRLGMLQLFGKDRDGKFHFGYNPELREKADRQSLLNITQYPARGFIYDRNGKLLVHNEAVYDLMVIPRMVKDLDTAFFCQCLGITQEDFNERMLKARKYSPYTGSIFMKQISKEEYAKFENKMYRFKGFYISQRTLRIYDRPIAAQVLGYVGEVNDNDLKRDSYYQMGDYIGKSGLEKSYEEVLRGIKGKKIIHRDVHSREIGPYRNGTLDTLPIEGGNLYTTLDADLQAYAEDLMANKRGCVVAIEPSTGEVLAMVSAPTYDPNLLVGRVRGKNYQMLDSNISTPMLNRALQGQYPPGSIFKVAQAVIALQLGVITPNTGFVCDKHPGCHNHPSARSVREAIKMSCNPYFYQVYKRVIQQGKYKNIYKDAQYGLTVWHDYMMRFGFGQKLDIDLPKAGMSTGNIPDTAYYNNPKWYGEGRWAFSTIYSNSIGQGEVTVVPIQMANLAAIVANRGWYITPHVVRFYGPDSIQDEKYTIHHETGIDKKYFDIAADGMYDVVHVAGGTARRARVDGLDICGKTGTAQNGTPLSKRDDHSVFIAFAPKNDPKIAIAVYVENAKGGGGFWAAPIASLVIEKYLTGEVKRTDVEKMYRETNPCQPPVQVKKQKK